MPCTIKDVAREAGVSVSTVSYALNGGPRPVPAQVSERIHEVARRLSYRPNRAAQSLVTRRTNAIGVVPREAIEDLAVVTYFAKVFNGIVNGAEQEDFDVMLLTRILNGQRRMDAPVDGLIFLAPSPDFPPLQRAREENIPFVIVSGQTRIDDVATYRVDNARGIEAAVDHLTRLGHRSLAFGQGHEDHSDAWERQDAFLQICEARGLTTTILPGDFTPQGGERGFEAWRSLSPRPTAVICANDDSAFGFMSAARRADLSVPGDVSVVGFDDADYAAHTHPQLTTIRQPFDELGRRAVSELVRILSGAEPESRRLAPQLVVRQSTDIPSQGPQSGRFTQ